jgi:hypothetical protein
MQKKLIINLIVVLIASVLAGCVGVTTYSNLKPVYPKPNAVRMYSPVPVDSLRPTFKWASPAPGQKVDLIIWEAFKSVRALAAQYDSRGDVVYYKEGIAGDEHQVEKELLPDTAYFWSIRPSGTTPWSTANHHLASIGTSGTASGIHFIIKTPKR